MRTRDEYEATIFEPLRAAAKRLDPAGLLKPEFLNARGAIARFERGAIEQRSSWSGRKPPASASPPGQRAC